MRREFFPTLMLALSLGCALTASAEPSPTHESDYDTPSEVTSTQGQVIETQLPSIQARVAERSEALEKLAAQRKSLELELKKLKAEIETRALAGKSVEIELVSKRAEQQELSESAARIEKELSLQRERAGKRLRALYMYRPARLFEAMVTAGSTSAQGSLKGAPPAALDAARIPYLFAKVRESDRKIVLHMISLQEQQEAHAVTLERVIRERDALKKRIEVERAVLRERAQQKELLITRVKEEKQQIEVVLSELRAESLRLETVVASLISSQPGIQPETRASVQLPSARSGQENGLEARIAGLPKVAPVPASVGVAEMDRQAAPAPYEGPGLRALRKSLVAPARGQVVRRFGKQRHGEFSDFVFQRGVELNVPAEKPIKAVAPGRVVFAGELPGFGKVIIVDHGKRSYSLYGRLKERLVTAGAELEKGAPVGIVDAADRRGSNFYFEVRENGAPVNPASLFSNL
jgi:septal ring factor EnvC (AmiA/AmiB activator)